MGALMVHENSKKAFKEIKPERLKRKDVILDIYKNNVNKALTDRQILSIFGGYDINNVQPRITELISDGVILEVGKTQCSITGKTVRKTMLVDGGVQTDLFGVQK